MPAIIPGIAPFLVQQINNNLTEDEELILFNFMELRIDVLNQANADNPALHPPGRILRSHDFTHEIVALLQNATEEKFINIKYLIIDHYDDDFICHSRSDCTSK